MTHKRQQPPSFYSKLFEWFCKENVHDELQGDLEEEFNINYRTQGKTHAHRIYKREVIKMLRPSVIKKFKSQRHYNHTAMFRNYSIVALRSLMRNKLFSSINIIGLSVSMAVGLLAITFVSEIYSYDNFHKNGSRIYRVTSDISRDNQGTTFYATSSILTGIRYSQEFSSAEKVAPIFRGMSGDLTLEETVISIKGIYSNNDFFDIFTFPLLYGNPETALSEPYTVVLTEDLAMRLFGKTDVVGEVLEYSTKDQLTITGVAKNPPRNSHLQFDAIGALQTLVVRNSSVATNWRSHTASYLYILVPDGQKLDRIQSDLNQLAQQENAKVKGYTITPGLEAMNDIFPGRPRSNQFGTVMPSKNVNSIMVLALIVILAACFNYTNLSIARSIKRSKEVGVRKVVGARRFQLISQFMIEAIMVSLLALVIAFFLFKLIKPGFLTLNFYVSRTTSLELTIQVYFYFLAFAILVGALAGLLPASMMSKLKPVSILKGVSSVISGKGIGLQKVLTAIQFTLSMGFFILVTLVSKQYRYALNYDLGFSTENVLNVSVNGNDHQLLINAFQQFPEVTGISTSTMLPSVGSSQYAFAKADDPSDSVITYTFNVDEAYLSNMGHELIAGNDFTKGSSDGKVVVNEMFLKQLNLGTPIEALNKQITYFQKDWTIIGVVKDFNARMVNEPMAPFIFRSGEFRPSYINLRLATNDITNTMSKVSEAWTKIDPNHDLEAMFYSDEIERAYSEVSSSVKTYGLLAGVAISISILGLLGMAVYTTEIRLKELTIRKVLGATISNLVLLLSKSFLAIFIISAAIAIPAAYYMFQQTIMAESVNRISIGFWELSGGALLIIAIAFFTISSQTLKAAKSNPAENLRNE